MTRVERLIQGGRKRRRSVVPVEASGAPSNAQRAVADLLRGEISFLFFTGVCVALHPGFVLKWNEGGMSNYGLHLRTGIPFTLALGLLALFSGRAARRYAGGDAVSRRLSLLLWGYCGTVLSVMLSSFVYSLNLALKDVHYVFSTLLLVLVGIASIWIYRLWPPKGWDRLALFAQLLGDALALLTIGGGLHFLFAAEILSNVGFAGLLIRTGRRVALHSGGEIAA